MNLQEQTNRIKQMMGVINENTYDTLSNHLIGGKYLYHYTLTDNLDSITDEGLVPRKYPNSYYKNGTEGIFLTNSPNLYNANLPQSLMDVMNDYYENEELLDTKPIVRLTIDISQLDFNLFDVDDDYKLNQYKWNKSQGTEEELIESLEIWRAISYKGTITPDLIKDVTFDYGN